MPPDARFPKLRMPVTIRFGRPIDVSRYADRPHDHLVLRQIIDEVMYEIRQLSGQEYVNEYASRKASAEPEPAERVTIDLRPAAADTAADHVPSTADTATTAAPVAEVPVDAGVGGSVVAGAGPAEDEVRAEPVPVATGNGHGSPRATRSASDRRSGRRAADGPETEFAKATRPRSSADVLRNPPRRAHLANADQT
jgi:hypothetical protein